MAAARSQPHAVPAGRDGASRRAGAVASGWPESVSRFSALEVGADVGRVLIPQVAILFEALVDDALPVPAGTSGSAHRRHRRAVENGVENDRRAVAAKRPLPGGHLVEHDAERKQIRARVEWLSRGPAPATCTTRCRACCPDRSSSASAERVAWSETPRRRWSGGRLRQAEIENLRSARRHEDVRRLDVAMDDALACARRRGRRRRAKRDVDECRASRSARASSRCWSVSPSSSSIAMNGGSAPTS